MVIISADFTSFFRNSINPLHISTNAPSFMLWRCVSNISITLNGISILFIIFYFLILFNNINMFGRPEELKIPIYKKHPQVCIARPDCQVEKKQRPDHKFQHKKDYDREVKENMCK
tara:strand:- start:734 stop:1081 length:348 start_codon:yes stop_codon:yes gene_type:complete